MTRGAGIFGLSILLLCACSGGTGHASARPSTTTTTTTGARAAMAVSIELPSDTMPTGSTMRATVVIENNTGAAVAAGCQLFAVALGNDRVTPNVAFPAYACLRNQHVIPVGRSTYPVQISATYTSCNPLENSPNDQPRCLPGHGAPPLPPGDYRAVLFQRDTDFPSPAAPIVHVRPAA